MHFASKNTGTGKIPAGSGIFGYILCLVAGDVHGDRRDILQGNITGRTANVLKNILSFVQLVAAQLVLKLETALHVRKSDIQQDLHQSALPIRELAGQSEVNPLRFFAEGVGYTGDQIVLNFHIFHGNPADFLEISENFRKRGGIGDFLPQGVRQLAAQEDSRVVRGRFCAFLFGFFLLFLKNTVKNAHFVPRFL
ncbi:MAG: hypothetical protein Q3W85_07375, partial [Oscillospiraceae bacterium]|nr:hypothetical protein [Oscillospiraceae bacterium]